MKDIVSVDYRTAVRTVVRRHLKDELGVKIAKEKDAKTQTQEDCCVFGGTLTQIPCRSITNECVCSVPSFLVDACDFLTPHLKLEGLFRKSGSVGRQKVLREFLGKGNRCGEAEFALPHDVAALVKQFFRELRVPLIVPRLTVPLVKALQIENEKKKVGHINAILLLLPDVHLSTLRYFSRFLDEMANHSLESLMTAKNLSIVFAPNLFEIAGGAKERASEKAMKELTEVTELIFKNSTTLGMVPEYLLNQAALFAEEDAGTGCQSSGDEIENEAPRKGVASTRKGRTVIRGDSKKRTRSNSITGFVNGLRRKIDRSDQDSPAPGVPSLKPRRSISACGSPREYRKMAKVSHNEKISSAIPVKQRPPRSKKRSPPKRSPAAERTGLSPTRKSPRFSNETMTPQLTTLPNQLFMTPRRHLRPIQPVADDGVDGCSPKVNSLSDRLQVSTLQPNLPDKFEFGGTPKKTDNNLSVNDTADKPDVGSITRAPSNASAKSAFDSSLVHPPLLTECMYPTPNLSRATQKPCIRKCSRTSSMELKRPTYVKGKRVFTRSPTSQRVDDQEAAINNSSLAQKVVATSSATSQRVVVTSTSIGEVKLRSAITPAARSMSMKKLADSPATGRKLPVTPYRVTPQVGSGKRPMSTIVRSPPKFEIV